MSGRLKGPGRGVNFALTVPTMLTDTPGRHPSTAVLLAAIAFVCACEGKKQTTPAEVMARYHATADTLDLNRPGAATETLHAFLEEYARYTIADSAEILLKQLSATGEDRYRVARALARDGEFDLAQEILEDLSRLDTEDGKSARRHLEFEFYMEKARWLLVHQRFEEASAVARELQTHKLSGFQRDEAEKILDYTGLADDAMQMTAQMNTRNACKQLMVFLASLYADNGQYPGSFTIADLEQLDPYNAKSLARSLAAIENYSATQDHYSLVAVGKDGSRCRIEDGELKD
jgi:hypothetical protein